MYLYLLISCCFLSIARSDLYTEDDHIAILTNDTFNNQVIGSNNAWFIEFYASWCGHCQRFAPKWKLLAQNVTGRPNVILKI